MPTPGCSTSSHISVADARVVFNELAEGLVDAPGDAGPLERRTDLGELARLEPGTQDRCDQVAILKAPGLGVEVDAGGFVDLRHLLVCAGHVEQRLPLAVGEGHDHHVALVAGHEVMTEGAVEVVAVASR